MILVYVQWLYIFALCLLIWLITKKTFIHIIIIIIIVLIIIIIIIIIMCDVFYENH